MDGHTLGLKDSTCSWSNALCARMSLDIRVFFEGKCVHTWKAWGPWEAVQAEMFSDGFREEARKTIIYSRNKGRKWGIRILPSLTSTQKYASLNNLENSERLEDAHVAACAVWGTFLVRCISATGLFPASESIPFVLVSCLSNDSRQKHKTYPLGPFSILAVLSPVIFIPLFSLRPWCLLLPQTGFSSAWRMLQSIQEKGMDVAASNQKPIIPVM